MKCQNCGAEIGDKTVCEFCGSQITAEMQKDQEMFNRSRCPKCDSTNVKFSRENQGEVRGKNSKKVIHTTVGVCKDCGHTWYPNGNSGVKQRKTWLWILGWIFCFPIPLTIILMKNKKLNPKVKYILIALAWILAIILVFANRSGSNNTVNSNSNMQNTSSPVSTEAGENLLDVTLNVTPKINNEIGTVLFDVETNLPDNTKLDIIVKNSKGEQVHQDEGMSDKVTVLANGHGYTSEYSENGGKLIGKYTVILSVENPSLQKDEVKQVIGQNGEKMTGKFVSQNGEIKKLKAEFSFEF